MSSRAVLLLKRLQFCLCFLIAGCGDMSGLTDGGGHDADLEMTDVALDAMDVALDASHDAGLDSRLDASGGPDSGLDGGTDPSIYLDLLTVNEARPIEYRITIQPVVVADDDGSNRAVYLGDAAREAVIKRLVARIWAQAGVEVRWEDPIELHDTWYNRGNYDEWHVDSNSLRPQTDLDVVLDDEAGHLHSDSTVLNMFFARVTPGFADSETQFGGLASRNVAFVNFLDEADDRLGLSLYRRFAAVIAHEMGHTQWLPHVDIADNLMKRTTSTEGERLNEEQIQDAIMGGTTLVPL